MSTAKIRRQAEALVGQGQIREAGQLVERALQLQPFDTDLVIAKANVMLAGRQYSQAIQTLQELIGRRPDAVDARFLLGNAFRAVGHFQPATTCYEEVIRRAPSYPNANHFLGLCRQYSGDLPGAERAYARAVDQRPELALLHFRLGSVLHLQDRYGEAIAAYQTALRREPGHQQALSNLALALLAAERDDEAYRVARDHVALYPSNTMALANLSYSAIATERRETVDQLLDYAHLIRSDVIEPPDGYDDPQDFLREIISSIDQAPRQNASDETLFETLNGHVTTPLDVDDGRPVGALADRLRQQVADYIEQCRHRSSHPWASNLPDRWMLQIWGSVQGSGGYENPHCHPTAFISGIFCAQVPPEIADPANEPAGWVEFGRADESYRHLEPEEPRRIRPQPGLSILFPAYFFHRSHPFESELQRICLPFDVVAVRPR